jgi:stage II sporulation protein D
MTVRSIALGLMQTLPAKTGRYGWLTAILWLVFLAPAYALDLRVMIQENSGQVNIGSSSNALVRDESGKVVGELASMNGFTAQPTDRGVALDRWKSSTLSIEPKDRNAVVWIGDKWYRGKAVITRAGSGLTAVNHVDMDQYLWSVLGGEMNGNWPQEALKAQAVAARSYALFRREKGANVLYDVGNTTLWQVYRGVQDESGGTQKAVNDTTRQVVIIKGTKRIIEAVFHSSSGGHTENSEDVWSSRVSYLRAVQDYDEGAPVYRWNKTFTRSDLSSRISGVGLIKSILPDEKSRTQGERYLRWNVEGDGGKRSISAEDLQGALDLKSSKVLSILPEPTKTASTKPMSADVSFNVTGGGFGHGLGMSQYGAYNMASKLRWNHQQILMHFYSGTQIGLIDQ